MISLLDESIAELKPKQAPKPAAAAATRGSPAAAEEPEKWSRENHPAFKKAAAPAEEKVDAAVPVSYKLNDTVLAKWVTGDRAFYPARITSITGSSNDPVYIVKFKSYDNTETLRAKDLRPVSNKRKADGTPASSGGASPFTGAPTPASQSATPTSAAPSATANNGIVTSASASIYPEQQARLEAEKNAADAAAKPPKPKKIRATRELEKGKNKWQEFNSKSRVGKTQKKDSMFRTPDGVHGRGSLISPPPPEYERIS
jgi:survival of motor neuron-related-splicing factor 30